MEFTQDQLSVLDNYFNGQADLPVRVAEIAAVIRNTVSPENPAAPIETEDGPEVIAPEVVVEEPVETTPAPAPDVAPEVPVEDVPVTPEAPVEAPVE